MDPSTLPKKDLRFIHITKTAGTSIEEIAFENRHRWGRYHNEYNTNSISSESGWWHEKFSEKPLDLKQKYDWFMIVRNPYSRIVSEYYWIMEMLEHQHRINVSHFNEFIHNALTNLKHERYSRNLFQRREGHHFTEQYKYIDSSTTIYVLRFEDLKNEFNSLMKLYKLPMRLTKHLARSSRHSISEYDLNDENIELIKEIYAKDFEIFGYSMDIENKSILSPVPPTSNIRTIDTILKNLHQEPMQGYEASIQKLPEFKPVSLNQVYQAIQSKANQSKDSNQTSNPNMNFMTPRRHIYLPDYNYIISIGSKGSTQHILSQMHIYSQRFPFDHIPIHPKLVLKYMKDNKEFLPDFGCTQNRDGIPFTYFRQMNGMRTIEADFERFYMTLKSRCSILFVYIAETDIYNQLQTRHIDYYKDMKELVAYIEKEYPSLNFHILAVHTNKEYPDEPKITNYTVRVPQRFLSNNMETHVPDVYTKYRSVVQRLLEQGLKRTTNPAKLPSIKLLVCTHMDSSKTLLEWTAHQLNLGANHIHIYELNNSVGVSKKLKEDTNVSSEVLDIEDVVNPLEVCMRKAIEYAKKNQYEWILYLESTDYPVFNSYNYYNECILDNYKYHQIGFPVLEFSLHKPTEKLCIEQNIRCGTSCSPRVVGITRVSNIDGFCVPGFYTLENTELTIHTSDGQHLDSKKPYFHPIDKTHALVPGYIASFKHLTYDEYLQSNSINSYTKKEYCKYYSDYINYYVRDTYANQIREKMKKIELNS